MCKNLMCTSLTRGRFLEERNYVYLIGTFLVAQMVKHLPLMRETWVQSLGWEDLLEKEMAAPFSILAWKIP